MRVGRGREKEGASGREVGRGGEGGDDSGLARCGRDPSQLPVSACSYAASHWPPDVVLYSSRAPSPGTAYAPAT